MEKRNHKQSRQERKGADMAADRVGLKDLLIWKTEKGMNKCRKIHGIGKGKEKLFPRVPRGMQPYGHLAFSPETPPGLDSNLKNCKVKSVWFQGTQFVMFSAGRGK